MPHKIHATPAEARAWERNLGRPVDTLPAPHPIRDGCRALTPAEDVAVLVASTLPTAADRSAEYARLAARFAVSEQQVALRAWWLGYHPEQAGERG